MGCCQSIRDEEREDDSSNLSDFFDLAFIRYFIVLALIAATSLLAGSVVGDGCSPRASVSALTIKVFTTMSAVIVPSHVAIIVWWWRVELPEAWGTLALLKVVHLAAVAAIYTCQDARLAVYIGAASCFLLAAVLLELSSRGYLSKNCKLAGAAALALWFAVFSLVAWGVVRRGYLWVDCTRLASLAVLSAQAVAAAVEATRLKDTNV